MTESEIIARGNAADRICSDPIYEAAWQAIVKDLFKAWQDSPLDDVAGRERQRLELDVLQRLKGKFAGYLNDAAMAQAAREHKDLFER